MNAQAVACQHGANQTNCCISLCTEGCNHIWGTQKDVTKIPLQVVRRGTVMDQAQTLPPHGGSRRSGHLCWYSSRDVSHRLFLVEVCCEIVSKAAHQAVWVQVYVARYRCHKSILCQLRFQLYQWITSFLHGTSARGAISIFEWLSEFCMKHNHIDLEIIFEAWTQNLTQRQSS